MNNFKICPFGAYRSGALIVNVTHGSAIDAIDLYSNQFDSLQGLITNMDTLFISSKIKIKI